MSSYFVSSYFIFDSIDTQLQYYQIDYPLQDTIAANDNPDKRFIASEIITHLSSHRIGARVLAKSGRLIGLLFATIYDCSNIVALRHEAMKAILNIIQDEKAALFVVDKNILPSLASFTVSNDEDDVLRRAALKVLMALIPSL